MWDFPLYTVNMFYYHWLKKNLFWTYGSAEQIKAGIPNRDRGEKKAESERRHVAAKRDRTLPVNHGSDGKIQNIAPKKLRKKIGMG